MKLQWDTCLGMWDSDTSGTCSAITQTKQVQTRKEINTTNPSKTKKERYPCKPEDVSHCVENVMYVTLKTCVEYPSMMCMRLWVPILLEATIWL